MHMHDASMSFKPLSQHDVLFREGNFGWEKFNAHKTFFHPFGSKALLKYMRQTSLTEA